MSENKANAISVSLLNRKIYAVCFTDFDTIASFHDAMYTARRRFFESGKAVHIRETGIYSGLSGELRGKLSLRTLKWEKTAGGRIAESSFVRGSQRGIEYFAPNGALRARVYFDREQHWLRTEYFTPDDALRAKICFKPDDARDAVLRFDYNYSTGKTKETMLFPVPYAFQSAEQSLQNAQCGNSLLLVADERGEYAYCPREEQQRRIRFLKENKNASVMLSMGWEVRDGDIAPQEISDAAPSEAPEFPALEETARTESPNPMESMLDELFEAARREARAAAQESAAEPESRPQEPCAEAPAPEEAETPAEAPAPEGTEAPAEAPQEAAPEASEPDFGTSTPSALDELGISAEDAAHARDVLDRILEKPASGTAPDSSLTIIRGGRAVRYTGGLKNGLRIGFGCTETASGVPVYEGEYKNDLRDGFGTHHYASGAVSYIGDFKADKRDGFGVSFRESDHALHVSRWVDGKPEGYAALFDPNGAMRFAGKIIGGQKQGAGVSIDPERDTVFVARYENNEMTGEGALFSGDGTLLYVGGWENGKRQGHGTEFDRSGDVVYSGEWKDDRYHNGILYKKVQQEN
ncbi:MAG: hypothetical protein ACI4GO_10355 [Hominenteromicrobium sp.]